MIKCSMSDSSMSLLFAKEACEGSKHFFNVQRREGLTIDVFLSFALLQALGFVCFVSYLPIVLKLR